MFLPKKYAVMHRSSGFWLCEDGGHATDPHAEDVMRFVTQGGGTRWAMRKFPEFLSAYIVKLIPPAAPAERPAP